MMGFAALYPSYKFTITNKKPADSSSAGSRIGG